MKKRLLIVEDDIALLKAIAACLEIENYEVMTARSGRDALIRIAETLPDLIVSDVMMPNGDGYSLIKNLRSNPRTDLIPVILLTAKDGRANRLNGLRAGVDAYLTKPFEPEELIVTIKNILTRVARTQTRNALSATSLHKEINQSDVINSGAAPKVDSDLTEAEQRIAVQVAEGLSNKEIAVRLKISVRTVESHVSHILAKKGWSNRVEIARNIGSK